MKSRFFLLLTALLLMMTAAVLADALPQRSYEVSGREVHRYDSESLKYTVESLNIQKTPCYLTKVWMASPGEQIIKATSTYGKRSSYPANLAKDAASKPALAVSGSGSILPSYPWIPSDYPGKASDYHFTPLGSVVITDGQLFRALDGVPYYGLTLQQDGLHMHTGDDPAAIANSGAMQTWSFYDACTLIADRSIILPAGQDFASSRSRRTVIAKVDSNNYIILTTNNKGSSGMDLYAVTEWLHENIDPEWAYNLTGGYSASLIVRAPGSRRVRAISGNSFRVVDIMGFTELAGEVPAVAAATPVPTPIPTIAPDLIPDTTPEPTATPAPAETEPPQEYITDEATGSMTPIHG